MKYNSIGEQLITKAKELDPSYKPDKFNDMSEAINIILNNSGGGIKKVSVNADDMTWDISQVDITKDGIIILTDTSGNSYGIASYSQINSNPIEFGYILLTKMLYPYVGNYANSVEFITYVLKLDGTIGMIYEGYYNDESENSITFFNEDMISGEDNYRVSSLVVPGLPSDASTKTYILKAVNGTLTWQTPGTGGIGYEEV